MLLINNNILLSSPTFESHFFRMKDLPFFFHPFINHKFGSYNTHENIEFLYFLKGTARIRYNGDILTVGAGQLVTINSLAAHQVLDGVDLTYHCLIVDKKFYNDSGIDPAELLFPPMINDPRVYELITRISEAYDSKDIFRTAAIKASILDFLLFMCRNYATVQKRDNIIESDSYKRIQKAINYIKENIDKKITVDDLADHVRISKYHFLRQFKSVTGDTAVNYINRLRCEYAKLLFRTSSLSVKETASMCGFDNCSYFAKIFKQYNGITPHEFLSEINTIKY